MTAHEHCDVVGTGEVARRLGVREGTVRMWQVRGLLPRPLGLVGRAQVWCWPDVAVWAAETGRLK